MEHEKRQGDGSPAQSGCERACHDRDRDARSSVDERQGQPAPRLVPNATTVRAMRVLESGQGKRADAVAGLFRALGI